MSELRRWIEQNGHLFVLDRIYSYRVLRERRYGSHDVLHPAVPERKEGAKQERGGRQDATKHMFVMHFESP
jgi:hypothetical protein